MRNPGHVALVGLSGSGKSTLAPLLASRTGRALSIDLDRVVEEMAGRTVAEIFAEEGETGFRALESQALAEALAGPPAVIATGGGVVLERENRRLLRDHAEVVWLRATPAHLAERLQDTSEARPLLDGDAEFALHRMATEREALYSEVADLVVDVDGVDPRTLVDELAERLG
ncbi:MAG TPA: shikimate kinase [Microthrixaceae bacterium]|nr:shikimate kinase [Microthrixaceae bacterium]